jgi:hypothetical protein
MLSKAIYQGYLKGCPNLTAAGIAKYLNPSPVTAKGHMKHPQMGIRSTQRNIVPVPIASLTHILTNFEAQSTNSLIPFQSLHTSNANMIEDEDTSSDTNMFCFAAFADKRDGILYNNLTRMFPFMSLEGNVCFLIVYHYESIAVLALPIAGFSKNIIYAA